MTEIRELAVRAMREPEKLTAEEKKLLAQWAADYAERMSEYVPVLPKRRWH